MAYAASDLSVGVQLIGGKYRIWIYRSTDPFATVDDTDYFALAGLTTGGSPGMMEGDFVFCVDTNEDPPVTTMAYVSAIDSDGNATVSAVAFAGAATFTTLTSTGNATIGDAAADTVGFHGVTVSQRAGSNQVTTNVVTSASYGTLQVAMMQEVMNTLAGKGLWKGAA